MPAESGGGAKLTDAALEEVLKRFGATAPPRTPALYRQALTHRSCACARRDRVGRSGERLEFVGDAVLALAVTMYLYERYPDVDEGFLTRMRTQLVSGASCADLCRAAGLAHYIEVSSRAEEAGARARRDVLEDAFEAFLAALAMDLGFDVARTWLVSLLEEHVDFALLVTARTCPKDALNLHFQRAAGRLPEFAELPPLHPERRRASVRAPDGSSLASGEGATVKEAEADAARRALVYLGLREDGRGNPPPPQQPRGTRSAVTKK